MPRKNMAAASLVSAKRWSVVLGLAVAFAFTSVPLALNTASAHHGWPTFDTSRLVYIAGTVSSEGVWGNPHSEFDVKLDASLPPDTPELPIPEELQHPEDSVRINRALAYDGSLGELEIVIAPPAWSGRWGLDRRGSASVSRPSATSTAATKVSFVRWCSGTGMTRHR